MLIVIWFSECSKNYHNFIIFLKKCKQTAEISWLFYWDVKISKKFIKQKFSIFIQMWQHTFIFVVKQPNGRKSHANIHGLLLTAKCQPYLSTRQFFYILFVTSHFWILWKKTPKKLLGSSQNLKKLQNMTKISKFFS